MDSKRPDVFVTGVAVVIIVFAIVITSVVQGPPPKTFSQVITVGPVWDGDTWSCISSADFVVHGALRGLANSQLTINVADVGTQSLYSLSPGGLDTFSVGSSAGHEVLITRTGTVTGFLTLQTTTDAAASCKQS